MAVIRMRAVLLTTHHDLSAVRALVDAGSRKSCFKSDVFHPLAVSKAPLLGKQGIRLGPNLWVVC